MAKFALLGSSYIARLGEYCSGDIGAPGESRFYGKGGMKTTTIPQDFIRDLLDWGPDCCFIHLGGNDISASSSPGEIFKRLRELAEDLRQHGVRVYIGEILPRVPNSNKSPGLTQLSFDKQRKVINTKLSKHFRRQFITFRDIKFLNDYATDKIHFATYKPGSNSTGMRKYYFRIKRLAVRSVQHASAVTITIEITRDLAILRKKLYLYGDPISVTAADGSTIYIVNTPRTLLIQDDPNFALPKKLFNKLQNLHYSTNVQPLARGHWSRKSSSEVYSLYDMCMRVLMDNIDSLDYVGGVPYNILKPVLETCTAKQLYELENYNPLFLQATDKLWKAHCERDFKGCDPGEFEAWRELYLRKSDEIDAKLQSLRENITKPISRTKTGSSDDHYCSDIEDAFLSDFVNSRGRQGMAQLLQYLLPLNLQVINIWGSAGNNPLLKFTKFRYRILDQPSTSSESDYNPGPSITPACPEKEKLVPDIAVVKDERIVFIASVKPHDKLRRLDESELMCEMLTHIHGQITGVVMCATHAKMISMETEDGMIVIKEKLYTYNSNLPQEFQCLCQNIVEMCCIDKS